MLGHRVPFDLLATVTGTAEDDLIPALRALVEQGVLVESGDDEFTFRHALVREALTGHLLGREKRRLHEAALDALLAGADADPALVAHHAKGAGRYDDMVAAAPPGRRALPRHRLAVPGAAAGRDGPGGGGRRHRTARLRGPRGLARRADRRRHRARAPLAGQRRPARRDRAAALYVLVRLTWEADDYAEMARLTGDIEALVAAAAAGRRPGPGDGRGRPVGDAAGRRTTRRSSGPTARIALADQFDLPEIRLAALVEKGATLTEHGRRPPTRAARSSPASSTRRRSAANGCWPPGRSTTWPSRSRRTR